METESWIEDLHFLRPLLLLALPVVFVVWWRVRRITTTTAIAANFPPHLAAALTVSESYRARWLPVDGIALALVLATVAAAGPAWRLQPAPWYTETQPVVVAVEVSDSMRSNDFLPTRLDRVRLKILDLAEARTGGRTGLIAYAGSAHLVVPPTTDIAVVKPFLESLDPAMMPVPGNNLSNVLPLARSLLEQSAETGSIVIVTDGIAPVDATALSAFNQAEDNPSLIVYLVGTEQGGIALLPDGSVARNAAGGRVDAGVDLGAMRALSRNSGFRLIEMQSTFADIPTLVRAIESATRAADDPDARWVDEGWWLLWPMALIFLMSFRRGWTMQW